MGEIFNCDFDPEGDFSHWTGTDGTPAVQAVIKHHNANAMQATLSGLNDVYKSLGADYATLFTRFYWQTDALPANDEYREIMNFWDASLAIHVKSGYWNDGGTYKWYLWVDGTQVTFTETITANTWYCLEFEFDNVLGTHYFWRDAALKITVNKATAATIRYVFVGAMGGSGWTANGYIDCVVVADAYIGPESAGVTYSPKTRSSLPNTMMTMLNSKMLFG